MKFSLQERGLGDEFKRKLFLFNKGKFIVLQEREISTFLTHKKGKFFVGFFKKGKFFVWRKWEIYSSKTDFF